MRDVNELVSVVFSGLSAKVVDDQLIDELVGRAQAEGLQLTGEDGLLQQLTKRLPGPEKRAPQPRTRSVPRRYGTFSS